MKNLGTMGQATRPDGDRLVDGRPRVECCARHMARPTISTLRCRLTSVLILILILGSVGRGLIALADASPVAAIAGLVGPLCHVHPKAPGSPADPARQGCCDDCALCSAVLLPEAPARSAPLAFALTKEFGQQPSSELCLRAIRHRCDFTRRHRRDCGSRRSPGACTRRLGALP